MSESPPSRQRANLAQLKPPIASGFQPTTPCPTVLLHHTLPDGGAHFDWLLATEPRGENPLITFRMGHRVDELSTADDCDAIAAESIRHHRPAYLTYEGPVSGNRGDVTRVRSGMIQQWSIDDITRWSMVIDWDVGSGLPASTQHILLTAANFDMMHWKVSAAKPV